MISKRVAMLLSNPYKPDPRVQKEARSLIDSGYLVNLHCWDRQGKYPSDESRDGMEIHRISGRSGYGAGTRQTLHIPGFWRSAIQQVREYKPDIIHCHDLDTLPAGWFLKRNMDTKLVYDAHEDYPALMNLYLPGIFVYLLKILERRLLNHVDSVITPSTELADKFRSLGVEQVKTVGNYQSLENYDAISEIDIHATRSKFNLEREDLVITYIGNFSRNRLLLPLIEAAKHLPHVHVLLWGDGHQRQDIERAISYTRNVHYLGWSPHDQVPLQFSIADIVYYCLVPDFPGSMPNALSSALAAGKPIIANDIGDLGRIVRETGCGLLIPEVTPANILQAVEIMQNPEEYAKMAHAARKAAKTKYNWEYAENQLLQVYGLL